MEVIKVIVADDHQLFRTGISGIIRSFGKGFEVISEATDGKQLLEQLQGGPLPHIILMDLDMPVLDGISASQTILKKYPDIKIIVVSMLTDELTMIKMLRMGVVGYLSKDVDPLELRKALEEVYHEGSHITGQQHNKVHHSYRAPSQDAQMSDREREFVELACTDCTYKQIADQMGVSAKTVEGYRESVFTKFKVKSRIGLVLYAVKKRLIVVR